MTGKDKTQAPAKIEDELIQLKTKVSLLMQGANRFYPWELCYSYKDLECLTGKNERTLKRLVKQGKLVEHYPRAARPFNKEKIGRWLEGRS